MGKKVCVFAVLAALSAAWAFEAPRRRQNRAARGQMCVKSHELFRVPFRLKGLV